MMVRANRLDKD